MQRAGQSIRGIRKNKKPPTGSLAITASTSKVSFGSTLKVGKDKLEVIKQVSGYPPSNTNLTILDFTSFVVFIDTENTLKAEKMEEYYNSVEVMLNLYEEWKTG